MNSLKHYINKFVLKILVWKVKYLNATQFVFILSIVTGLIVGLAVVLLKNTVHGIQSLLTFFFQKGFYNFLYVIYPAIGILIVILLLKYVFKKQLDHGISDVLYSISQNKSIIHPHKTYTHAITSSITVGFGGSVGLEGPSVITGAAIGSNLSRTFHLNYKERTLLMGCAITAAIAAIFKAPIAGVIFALEVIMLDLTMSSIVPLLAASVTGALTSYLILGQGRIYTFKITEAFSLGNVHYYILLGIVCGLLSVYYTKVYRNIDRWFERFSSWKTRLLIGGLMLGVMISIFPPLFGEGFQTVNTCLQGHYDELFQLSFLYAYKDNLIVLILLLLTLALLKVVATSITFGSGGIGGNFAPTIFTGATIGLSFALLINYFQPGTLPASKFALTGMAGMIAGVSHAPLTAIFMIAEVTGGYELFLPLMITAVIGYVTAKFFLPNSIYTHQLAKHKILITHNKDKAALTLMRVENLLETDYLTLMPYDTLGTLVSKMETSVKNVYPVVDQENNFLGIVKLNDIRLLMFKQELYDTTLIKDLMIMPQFIVDPDDSMENIAQIIQATNTFHLPVMKHGKYLGFISRANAFSSYRTVLKNLSDH